MKLSESHPSLIGIPYSFMAVDKEYKQLDDEISSFKMDDIEVCVPLSLVISKTVDKKILRESLHKINSYETFMKICEELNL